MSSEKKKWVITLSLESFIFITWVLVLTKKVLACVRKEAFSASLEFQK